MANNPISTVSPEACEELLQEMRENWWQAVPWNEDSVRQQLQDGTDMSEQVFLWLRVELLKVRVDLVAQKESAAAHARRELVETILSRAPFEIDREGMRDRRTGCILHACARAQPAMRQRG